MYGEENIISAVIRVDETTPICIVIFAPLTKGESDWRKTIGDKKKMRRTQEKFLEAMHSKCLR